jgi:PD-(D/E)XK nuclease superfamily protein
LKSAKASPAASWIRWPSISSPTQPWGDSDRYDVIVRFDKIFCRVQLKSVFAMQPSRHSYRVKTTGSSNSTYSADEIDFLVAYIFAKDVWYALPVAIIAGRDAICVRPESEKCRLVQYREAWNLMKEAPDTGMPRSSSAWAGVSPAPETELFVTEKDS